jgi:hypothetical protein
MKVASKSSRPVRKSSRPVSKSSLPVSKSSRPVSKSARTVAKPPRPRKKGEAKPPVRKSKQAAPQPAPLPAASETTKHNTIPVQADWLEVVEPLIPKIPILFVPLIEPVRRRGVRPSPPPLPETVAAPGEAAAVQSGFDDAAAMPGKCRH